MQNEGKIYGFDEFRFDVDDKTLWHEQEKVHLPLKAVEMLTLLVENRGRTVTKDELLENLWQDTFVDENNLAVTVSALRKAFGERKDENRFIETVPRRGYRFVADTKEINGSVILEKHTFAEITLEKAALPQISLTKRNRNFAVLGILVTILIGVFTYWLWKPTTQTTEQTPEKTVPQIPQTIAVLPFLNLTNDNNNEFLCIGLTDAVITRLASVNRISVRPTSSVLQFGDSPTPQFVSEKLQVENVMEGTLQRIKNRLRISVQLVQVPNNKVLWAKSFEENDTDLLKIQESISVQIANSLLKNLSQEEQTFLVRNETEDDEAFALYLKGQYFLTKRGYEDLKKSLDFFQQAKQKDPNFSLAYIGIARVYLIMGDSGWSMMTSREAVEKARPELERGLQLNPNTAEAFAMLAAIQMNFDWDLKKAEQTLQQAIKLNPNISSPYHEMGWFLIIRENYTEAEMEFQKALRVEPTSVILQTEIGFPAFFAKRYDDAEKLFRAALDFDQNSVPARFNLWRVLHHQAKHEEAMNEIGKIEVLIGKDYPLLLMCKARTLFRLGKTDEAGQIYLSLKNNKTVSSIFLAVLATELGKKDEAFSFLDQGLAERNDYLLHLNHAPEFEALKNDARFSGLVGKVNLIR